MDRVKDVKDFLKKIFYEFEDISEEEAREELINMGEDLERIEKKKEEYLKKLEARKVLRRAEEKRKDMDTIIYKIDEQYNNESNEFKLAARKSNGEIEADERDKKILEELKKQNEGLVSGDK